MPPKRTAVPAKAKKPKPAPKQALPNGRRPWTEKPINDPELNKRFAIGFYSNGQPYVVSVKTNHIYAVQKKVYYKVALPTAGNKGTKMYQLHVLTAKTHMAPPADPDKGIVHHISGDTTDNSLKNLEWATGSFNAHARVGVKGYSLRKDGKYIARVPHPDGKTISAGVYATAAEAHAAHNAKYLELWKRPRNPPLLPVPP